MAVFVEHTILLVDDEPLILEVCGAVLRGSGYRVLGSRNGRTGLEIFQVHKDTVDLVISDVVMPDMSGAEMARLMLAEKSGLPIVFISGYGLDALPVGLGARFSVLAKPFTSEQFLSVVRAALIGETPRLNDFYQSNTTVLPE